MISSDIAILCIYWLLQVYELPGTRERSDDDKRDHVSQ
jgi:hypothetical protein